MNEYTKKLGGKEYVVIVVRVCKDDIESILGKTIINPLPTNNVVNASDATQQ